jgi:hypothetical protein
LTTTTQAPSQSDSTTTDEIFSTTIIESTTFTQAQTNAKSTTTVQPPMIAEATETEEVISKASAETGKMVIKTSAESTNEGASAATAESVSVTPSLTQNPQLHSNDPGITLESVSGLNEEIPDGCFEGVGDLCQSNSLNVTFCHFLLKLCCFGFFRREILVALLTWNNFTCQG